MRVDMLVRGLQNPAHAGMNLRAALVQADTDSKPRSRGDEPSDPHLLTHD